MKNTINLVSSQHDQLSYESSDWGVEHGFFKWFLVFGEWCYGVSRSLRNIIKW
jgi:hypothetical protein